MKTQVYIQSKKVSEELNQLLADYQILYQNLRAFHWLVKGPQFYMLHEYFEKAYLSAAESVDEIAERILMLGGTPLHGFDEYLSESSIEAVKNPGASDEMIKKLIEDLEYLLSSFRNILEISGEENDEGTSALMSDFISSTEKELWMLNSMNS